jgi:hypothetical protein
MFGLIMLITVTLLAVVITDTYFERLVSRPCPDWIFYLATAAMIVLLVFYVKYLIQTLKHYLKL